METSHVIFKVKCETHFGDTVRVVGSTTALGCWDPARGLVLRTDEDTYPYWSCSAQTMGAEDQEYKLVILRAPDSHVEWEPLVENRRLELGRLKKRVKVHASWGDASSDVRTGEQPASAAERVTPPQSPAAVPTQGSIAAGERRKSAPSIFPGGAPPAHWQSFSQPTPGEGGSGASAPRVAAVSFDMLNNPPLELPPRVSAVQRLVRVGDPLDAIASMDRSWPPSVASSLSDLDARGGHSHGSSKAGSMAQLDELVATASAHDAQHQVALASH
tara:strand:+ start:415 stop:1233 length:819 start_codon:yes stop_codon:yes gene_type:complete